MWHKVGCLMGFTGLKHGLGGEGRCARGFWPFWGEGRRRGDVLKHGGMVLKHWFRMGRRS